MKVLITGASGVIAAALSAHLLRQSHKPVLVSRRASTAQTLGGSGAIDCITWRQLTPAYMLVNRFDVIVNLAGAPMISYWTERRKAEILTSRLECTTRIYTLVRQLPPSLRPECIVNASSVAIYSSCNNPVDEWTKPNRQSSFFQAHVWQSLEDRVRQLRIPGVRTIIVRAGVVIGADCFLRSMLRAARLNLNFVIGSGKQKLSWIARTDLVRIIDFLLCHHSKAGIYNAVSPNCINAKELSSQISACVGHKCRLRLPERPLKILLGELASNFLISAEVRPSRLLDDAFRWKHPDFQDAVAAAAHELSISAAFASSSKALQPSPHSGQA